MKKRLKVAVYINGQWRGSSFKCSEFLKPYFEQFDVDYYIHTCDYYFGKNLKLDFSKNELPFQFYEIHDVYHSDEDIERIRNTYQNVVYFEIDTKEKNKEITLLNNNLSAFYNLYGGYKCNQYRKIYENLNGFSYDAIIKIRPDIIFKKNTEEHLKNIIESVSKNNNIFLSEHSLPRIENIELNKDYPIDIFQVGKNFFDVLDNWVSEILKGNSVFLSNAFIHYINNTQYTQYHSAPMRPYIVRELYKFNNLLELFYNDTMDYESLISGHTMCDLDEILYMENCSRNDKNKFFENWDIDFESIIKLSTADKQNNSYLDFFQKKNQPIYTLENQGLQKLADEIEKNWKNRV